MEKINSNIGSDWKVSIKLGKFPESLESFLSFWKLSWQSGKIRASLESFQPVLKVSRQSGKFLDSLESFHTAWKVFRQSGKFPDSLKSFQTRGERIVFWWPNMNTNIIRFHKNDQIRIQIIFGIPNMIEYKYEYYSASQKYRR